MTRIKQMLSAVAISVALCVGAVHAQTLVINDDFEKSYDGWTYAGESAFINAVRGEGYNSARGMKVANRKTPADGAMSNKAFYIEAGEVYNYSVYVKHAGTSNETFNLTLTWMLSEDVMGEEVIATAVVPPNTWTPINVSYATPRGSFAPTFIITTNGVVDFIFDRFTATGRRPSALARTAAMPPADVGLKDIYAKHFRVGNILHGGIANNAGIQAIMRLDYNSITAENEHKPNDYLRRDGSTNTNILARITSGAAAIMNFCQQNNIPMRGHVLTWHGQTPDWFFIQNINDERADRATNAGARYRDIAVNQVPWATPTVMNQRLESAIKNWFELVAEQYPTLYFYAYDVTNEAFDGNGNMRPPGFDHRGAGGQGSSNAGDSPWQAVYGANNIDWIRNAFTYARRYAPEHTKLFYNDYNEWQVGKREGIRDKVLIPFFREGILDGMGMQSHVSANPNDGWSGERAHLPAMDFYANIGPGFEVQLTELDPSTDNGTYTSLQPQRYANIFAKAMEINARNVGKVTAICIWTPNDANTWLDRGHTPALHDANNRRKPAYEAVASLVPQSDWGDGNNPTFEFGIGGGGGGIVVIEPDRNGYFFHHTYEDGTEQGWRGRGGEVANTTAQKANGSNSLAVTGRTATWHGAEYPLNTRAFIPGNAYSFSAIAMYNDGPEASTFKLTMSYTLRDTTRFAEVALVQARRGSWVMLANENFNIPTGATDLLLYVEMPDEDNPDLSFFVDDAMGGVAGARAPGRDGVTVEPDENGYLFHHTFETENSTENWGGRFGSGTVANTDEQKANGERALVMSGRTQTYTGPALSLSTGTFVPGNSYSFSVLAMYAEGGLATSSFKFTLQYELEGETVYDGIDSLEGVPRGAWVMLKNDNFAIPAGATNLVLYVEMPDNESSDIYIDDVMGGIAGAEAPGAGGVTSVNGRFASANRVARPLVSVRGKTLNISSPDNTELRIRLIDVRGRVRANFTASGSERFSMMRIPAGRYFVEVRGAGVRQTVPIVLK